MTSGEQYGNICLFKLYNNGYYLSCVLVVNHPNVIMVLIKPNTYNSTEVLFLWYSCTP